MKLWRKYVAFKVQIKVETQAKKKKDQRLVVPPVQQLMQTHA